MTLKRKNLKETYQKLSSLAHLKGIKFAYARAKNLEMLLAEIRSSEEGLKGYEEKRIELCKKMSEKDEKGEAIIENGVYKLVDVDKFNLALLVVQKEEKYEEFMDESIEIELFKVVIEEVPADISGIEMEHAMIMVKE